MRNLFRPFDQAPSLYEPRWLHAAIYAAAVTAAICWPAWPGFMSYDSLLAYEQVFTGVRTMTWPPMHTYLFWISERLGAGPGGLFLAQTFLLFFGAGVALNLLAPARWLALLAQLGFAAAFVYFPTLLGSALTQWRDVPTASFAVLGVALWLAAARYRSVPLLLGSATALGIAVALRYNAVSLIVLVAPAMVAAPFLGRPAGAWPRIAAAAGLVLALALAWASTQWRLPDLERLEKPDNFAGTQLFDLFGVTACSGRDYLPGAVTEGATVTAAQVRQAYDPRHLHLILAPRPGLPRFFETDGRGAVKRVWGEAVRREFPCYLTHRAAVFGEQMGLGRRGVYYPVHGAIDANSRGLALARPSAAQAVAAYVQRNAGEPWRRPALLYAAAAAVALAAFWRGRAAAPFLLALLGGCLAYPLLLFVAAPAADARYVFPSNVLCVLLVAAGMTAILGQVWPARGRR